MRIDDKFKMDINKLNEPSASKKKGADKTSSSADSSANDSVSLSSGAKEAAGLKESLKAAPDIRIELVHELRVKIESGQYNISGKQVAEKMVQSAIDDLF